MSLKPAAVPEEEVSAIEYERPLREAWRMFCKNRAAVAGLVILSMIVLMTILTPLLLPADPFATAGNLLSPPGKDGFILGTDQQGRSILIALMYGSQSTLMVGAAAALITITIGILVGALAGYYRGWVEEVLLRITEFFQVLPPLLLAMVVVLLFSPSIVVISIAIGIVSWTSTARLVRGEFLRLRELDFVKAERAIGSRNARIIWTIILPNAAPPLIVSAALSVGIAILFEAGLAFLKLSDPNVMSWGYLISVNRDQFLQAWWPVTFPGLAIFITVLCVSLIGDGLNDAFNPKLRQR